RVRQLGGHRLEAARVLPGGGDVVDGTGTDDHQQPVVLAAQDARGRVPPLGHRGRGPLGERQVLHQDLRRDQRADAFDAKVVRGAQHAGRRNLACFRPPCARPTAKGRGMMAMMRRGLDGFSDDVRAWRAATPGRAPVYHRLLEDAVALFQAPVGSTEEAARARVEAAWRERKQASPYARPLLLMAALRAEGLRAGTRHPLFEAIAAPQPQVAAATRERLAAALGDASPRLFADLATRSVQTNETSRAVAWRWPAALAGCDGGARGLALYDLGCSAGLNLAADRLPPLWTDPTGAPLPVAPRARIVLRRGFDANPLDVNRDGDCLWLTACVWPGEDARLQRLTEAMQAFRALGTDPAAP